MTGCRLSEIQFLRREYVKDDCIELPDAKTGGRVVPLGPEARDDGDPWVIAGKVPGSHITDLQKPWRRIRARGWRTSEFTTSATVVQLLLIVWPHN